MVWTTPKTDWVSDDYVNASDINRIKNNIMYLYNFAYSAFPIDVIPNLGPDFDYTSYFYASDMNKFEEALKHLNDITFNFTYSTKVWYPNQSTPDFKDYNRIEGLCDKIHQELLARKVTLIALPVILGRSKEVKE